MYNYVNLVTFNMMLAISIKVYLASLLNTLAQNMMLNIMINGQAVSIFQVIHKYIYFHIFTYRAGHVSSFLIAFWLTLFLLGGAGQFDPPQ